MIEPHPVRDAAPHQLRRTLTRGGAGGLIAAEALDDSQRAAVVARGSLVRVLGGPGSGKSAVAVHAVLDRVADGTVQPHQALLLAPTRVAAARLRRQLTTRLGATTASPLVCSVQAFAYGVLRRRAAAQGEPEPRLLSGPEQDVVLRELLAGHEEGFGSRPNWPADLAEATRTRGFRSELRDLLMRAVEYGLDPEGLAALGEAEDKPVWVAAAHVLAEYDEVTALSTPGGYDPAWILTVVADLLADDEVRAGLADQVRVVVVDDAQELTAPAARLLTMLQSTAGEVVLVGDPDAATQSFRGADPRLMMEQVAVSTHLLERSWRLPMSVAAVAARVTDRIGSAGAIAHRLGPGGEIRETAVAERRQHLTAPRMGEEPTRLPSQPTLFDVIERDGEGLVAVADEQGDRGAEPQVSTGAWPDPRPSSALTSAATRQDSAAESPESRTSESTGSVLSAAESSPTPDSTGFAPSTPSVQAPQSEVREGAVETAVLPTATAEARYISARLRRAHLLDGVPYSRMAVLLRGAGRSATMRRVLAGDGIPVDIPGARVPLRDEPAVRPFLRLFEIALARAVDGSTEHAPGVPDDRIEPMDSMDSIPMNPMDPMESVSPIPPSVPGRLDTETVLDLLASPLGTTDSLAVRRLLRALRRAERRRAADGVVDTAVRSTDELLVAAVLGDPVLDSLDEGAPAAGLRRLRDVLAAGVRAAGRHEGGWSPGVTAETVLWAMWQSSALAEPWRRAALSGSHRADRDLDAVVALTDAAARYVDRLPQRGPDGFLEHVRGQDVAGDTLVARAPSDDCVTLTTPASSAGLDWDLVVVAGIQEGVWPDLRLRGSILGSAELVDTLTGRGRSSVAAREEIRSDEARLFLVAVSRARHTLVCTAVRNDDEAPSPFLDLVDGARGSRPYATLPSPMTLPDVVATLRRQLTASALVTPDGEPDESDQRAARLLARLAEAGVPGADPRQWWGLRMLSDDRPRRGEDDRLTVSPSKVEAFSRCELRWLLGTSGGQPGGGSVASSLGTLVHDIAATTDNGDFPALVAELDRRWSELDLPGGWLERRQREKAVAMLDRLAHQHTTALGRGWEVVGTEIDVEVQVGRAVIRGRVDRLERDAEGKLRVVDLKTGSPSSKPRAEDLPRLPQLGAYQVAVEEGGFGSLGRESAGAALMQIGEGGGKRGVVQEQGALADADDPTWARSLLTDTAEGMAGATFRARAGTWCRMCESRFSCPIQPEGETLR